MDFWAGLEPLPRFECVDQGRLNLCNYYGMTILMIRICLQFLLLSDSHPSSNPIVRTGPPSPIDLEAVVDGHAEKL